MTILQLAFASLANRKLTAILTVLAIAISVILLLGVEKVRIGARTSFLNTISSTDLIIGARTGDVQLLLYAVFRIGDATNNISVKTLEDIERRSEVKWIVPISLGDSHRGFRVMGTTKPYFEHYRYRRNTPLTFKSGKQFQDIFETVIGSEVAEKLNYTVGDKIVVAHGSGSVSFGAKHENMPFTVSGILTPTNTPVDKTVHVSLRAIEAIHVGWQGGTAPRGDQIKNAEEVRKLDLTPKAVTAAFVGLKSKIGTFSLQRYINNYKQEPVTAILPGVAFLRLWSLIGSAETALIVISGIVVFTAFFGMVISVLGSLNERRREMAILRALGARPTQVFGLFVTEAGMLSIAGVVLGTAIVYLLAFFARPVLEQATGLHLALSWPAARELTYLLIVVLAGIIAGIIPAIQAYRISLVDGLTIRV